METNVAGLSCISLYLELLILIAPLSGLIYCNSLRRNIKIFDTKIFLRNPYTAFIRIIRCYPSLCVTRLHSIFNNEWLRQRQVCNPWLICNNDP